MQNKEWQDFKQNKTEKKKPTKQNNFFWNINTILQEGSC